MKRFSLFKHFVLALAFILLSFGIWTLNTINLKETGFVGQLLMSSFCISSALVLFTYRISLIGLTRILWIPTLLALSTIALLAAMKYATTTVPNLWDVAIVLFTLLVCYTMIQRTAHKNALTYLLKSLVYLTVLMVLIAVGLKISTISYYNALNTVLMITSLAGLIHFFLPNNSSKITQ